MTNGKQLWPGDTMRAFFRAHIQRETSLDAAAAEKLSEALTKATNRMLIWDMPPAQSKAAEPSVAQSKAEHPNAAQSKPPASQPAANSPGAPNFNAYAFSAMVVLAKTGRDGLAKRLADIKSAADLKALAAAQHLAVSPSLKKPEELRKAIITATEQRLADRKAAAS